MEGCHGFFLDCSIKTFDHDLSQHSLFFLPSRKLWKDVPCDEVWVCVNNGNTEYLKETLRRIEKQHCFKSHGMMIHVAQRQVMPVGESWVFDGSNIIICCLNHEDVILREDCDRVNP